jgi:hypothetical protein
MKVVDTTFVESRGCGVCVSSSDELGIALTAHELSAAQSGYIFHFGYLYFGFAVSGVFVEGWCNLSYR